MSFVRSNWKIIALSVFGLLLIAPGYYKNAWGAVEPTFYSDWQAVFEPPVIGRLAKSAQDGVFSAGALLGLGDFQVSEGENVSVEVWMAPRKVVEHQYDAYLNGEKFTAYAPYESAPGAQGIILGAFDRFTNFPPNLDLKIFRVSEALLTALALVTLFAWFALEFGLLSMALAILFAAFSLWLTLLGGNLYWNLWAFFLPLLSLLFLLRRQSKRGHYSAPAVSILLLGTGLAKVLFNGFEFVTTAWVMYTVPLVYYAILDGWTWKDFLKRELSFVGIAAIVTAIGLLILATQVASVEGGYGRAASAILEALNRRSFGDPNNFSGVFQEALRANLGSVLLEYLHFPTLTLSGLEIQNSLLSAVVHLETWVWIAIFAIASGLLLFKVVRNGIPHDDNSAGYHPAPRKGLALLAATWYSALAPLSWLVLFKAHAYIHVRLAPVVWQMPFIFFGIALVGFTITSFLPSTIQEDHVPKPTPNFS
jgi:hypothetical protein